jgi:hypothetical protein
MNKHINLLLSLTLLSFTPYIGASSAASVARGKSDTMAIWATIGVGALAVSGYSFNQAWKNWKQSKEVPEIIECGKPTKELQDALQGLKNVTDDYPHTTIEQASRCIAGEIRKARKKVKRVRGQRFDALSSIEHSWDLYMMSRKQYVYMVSSDYRPKWSFHKEVMRDQKKGAKEVFLENFKNLMDGKSSKIQIDYREVDKNYIKSSAAYWARNTLITALTGGAAVWKLYYSKQ